MNKKRRFNRHMQQVICLVLCVVAATAVWIRRNGMAAFASDSAVGVVDGARTWVRERRERLPGSPKYPVYRDVKMFYSAVRSSDGTRVYPFLPQEWKDICSEQDFARYWAQDPQALLLGTAVRGPEWHLESVEVSGLEERKVTVFTRWLHEDVLSGKRDHVSGSGTSGPWEKVDGRWSPYIFLHRWREYARPRRARKLDPKALLQALIDTAARQRNRLSTEETTLTRIGEKAPLFEVTTLDGQSVKLSDLRGKVILLNLFATWCGPCLREMPRLENEIWQRFGNREFAMIAVAREENNSELVAFKRKHELTFSIAGDPKRNVYDLFAKDYIPRNYVIDTEGKIIFQSVGYTEDKFREMVRAVEQAVAGSGVASRE